MGVVGRVLKQSTGFHCLWTSEPNGLTNNKKNLAGSQSYKCHHCNNKHVVPRELSPLNCTLASQGAVGLGALQLQPALCGLVLHWKAMIRQGTAVDGAGERGRFGWGSLLLSLLASLCVSSTWPCLGPPQVSCSSATLLHHRLLAKPCWANHLFLFRPFAVFSWTNQLFFPHSMQLCCHFKNAPQLRYHGLFGV